MIDPKVKWCFHYFTSASVCLASFGYMLLFPYALCLFLPRYKTHFLNKIGKWKGLQKANSKNWAANYFNNVLWLKENIFLEFNQLILLSNSESLSNSRLVSFVQRPKIHISRFVLILNPTILNVDQFVVILSSSVKLPSCKSWTIHPKHFDAWTVVTLSFRRPKFDT